MMDFQSVSTENVRQAANLYDELGSVEFLGRYGFGQARGYDLVIGGRRYPSKAILAVAHGYATGRVLTSQEFSGGRSQTVRVLEKLGFIVRSRDGGAVDAEACMLLWNPKNYQWPDLDRLAILDETMHGRTGTERWSIFANSTKVKAGDRVFLRKTGDHPRGIVASGWVSGPPVKDGHWGDSSKRPTTYVDVSWDAMVEPGDVYDLSGIADRSPSAAWGAPGGGARIPAEAIEALESEWADHVSRTVARYVKGTPGEMPHQKEIEAAYGRSLVKTRRHQKAFRELLLREREAVCEYGDCGVTALEILEAAHIVPDSEGGKPASENGLLLCRNHHRAMDSGLLGYDGEGEFDWSEGVDPF